jgi:hypothetical protein
MSDTPNSTGSPTVPGGGATAPAAVGTSSDPALRREWSAHDQMLDELIFKQDLNEVHLLIDFISGRSDRSLSTLAMPNPHKDAEYPGDTLSSSDIVTRVAKMRYPPDDNRVVNSHNAAILLMAKDRLSALASPARGLTIAYTAMFVGSEGEKLAGFRPNMRLPARRTIEAERDADRVSPDDTSATPLVRPAGGDTHRTGPGNRREQPRDSRIDLAAETFPGLLTHARQFRKWRYFLALFSVLWLVITALAYWDVGLARSVLERLDQNWKTRTTVQQELAGHRCTPGQAGDQLSPAPPAAGDTAKPGEPPKAGEPAKPIEETDPQTAACTRLDNLKAGREAAQHELNRVFRCEGPRYAIPLHVWCWRWILSGSADRAGNVDQVSHQAGNDDKKAPADRNLKDNVDWQTATSILSVFTSYILPTMFALLGTLIGAFRSILAKIRDSELGPRDFVSMKLGIPMGLVAGIAVGLFFSPSSVPVEGAGGLAGDLTLTPSGLGFLAGYACQTFFHFLDELLKRIFPENTSVSAPVATQVVIHNPGPAPAPVPAPRQEDPPATQPTFAASGTL